MSKTSPVSGPPSRMQGFSFKTETQSEAKESSEPTKAKSLEWIRKAFKGWGSQKKREPTLEERVLAEDYIPNVPVVVEIDPNKALSVRKHEAEVLRREELQLKEDMAAIVAYIELMEQHNTEATNAEEKKKVELITLHQEFKRSQTARADELQSQQVKLQKQYEKYDASARKIKSELDAEIQKREEVKEKMNQLSRAISSLSKELDEKSKKFEKTFKQFLENIKQRREEDMKSLLKYQNAKRLLHEQITERYVVRRALENKHIDELPDEEEPDLVPKGQEKVQLESETRNKQEPVNEPRKSSDQSEDKASNRTTKTKSKIRVKN